MHNKHLPATQASPSGASLKASITSLLVRLPGSSHSPFLLAVAEQCTSTRGAKCRVGGCETCGAAAAAVRRWAPGGCDWWHW